MCCAWGCIMQLNIGHNKHFTESVSILWVMVMVKSLENTRPKSPCQVLLELKIKPRIVIGFLPTFSDLKVIICGCSLIE